MKDKVEKLQACVDIFADILGRSVICLGGCCGAVATVVSRLRCALHNTFVLR